MPTLSNLKLPLDALHFNGGRRSRILSAYGYFEDCYEFCPFVDYCIQKHFTNEEIIDRLELIKKRTGKEAVIRCPVFLDDSDEEDDCFQR